MQDLQEVTQEIHYENYRSEKLATGGSAPSKKVKSVFLSINVSAFYCLVLMNLSTFIAQY